MKSLAIIPARGGSKRIPRKNIKLFMGRPIIVYSIEAALQSGLFDEVMVSTDDKEIADIARQYGAEVPFMRSEKTSDDYATTADVIFEVLEFYKTIKKEFQYICCIYATAPFVNPKQLVKADKLLHTGDFDSIFSAVPFSYPVQRGLEIVDNKIRMVWPENLNKRSQDLETIYHDAGQFYFSRVDAFYKFNTFWGENTGGVILSELEVQDLDTMIDWELAEMKYQLLNRK